MKVSKPISELARVEKIIMETYEESEMGTRQKTTNCDT